MILFSLLRLMCCITFNDLNIWTIPISLGQSWFDDGVGYFWYAIEFSLPIFYWGFFASKFIKVVGL
jgi:hypothetical protein